jgi:hypothetical protein
MIIDEMMQNFFEPKLEEVMYYLIKWLFDLEVVAIVHILDNRSSEKSRSCLGSEENAYYNINDIMLYHL